MLLGCIADDLTGAADLADTLVRGGMRTIQTIGLPGGKLPSDFVDAIVVALKTRTIPPDEAVAQSMIAAAALRRAGAQQILFKYCSTFDSTDRGNIGPVIDALAAETGSAITVVCPAFPQNGRTVYQGHLFVGNRLLSESSMRNHPLTPMTDADLVRVLARQSRARVGLVGHACVRQGPAAIARALGALVADGIQAAIVDALDDDDLRAIGCACAQAPLISGGSGVALGLPDNFRRAGALRSRGVPDRFEIPDGSELIVAGSCSEATRAQVAHIEPGTNALRIDAARIMSGDDIVGEAVAFFRSSAPGRPMLVFSSASPGELATIQAAYDRHTVATAVELVLAEITATLVGHGARRIIVAGGETAGAVVGRLGVTTLRIGPQIEPGVPWTVSEETPPLALALKSGNFGSPAFFDKAFRMIP